MEVELIVNSDKTFSREEISLQQWFKALSRRGRSSSTWWAVPEVWSSRCKHVFGFMYFYRLQRGRLEMNVLQTSFCFGFRAKTSMSIQLSLCHVLVHVQCVLCVWFLAFLLWCSTFCYHLCPLPVLFWRFPLYDIVAFCTSFLYAWPPFSFKIYVIRLTWCRQSFLLTGLCPDLLHLCSPVPQTARLSRRAVSDSL